ncbi:ECF transporter S component [Pseudoramibacter alactolyticus]|uniref:ECF transporter S component n=1 Tax=Pseudoramibacter alactolyticus TaxID=113287 RepID=UPI0023532575|nr:ECF transporter S component [Pseudoramibacter alactolyticus]MBM6969138.1 ECF transporter S component [Pseudoramibacter alactolyticus]
MNEHHQQLLKITFTGLTAALAYVAFTFLQIKIPVGAGDQTSIHLGNAVVVLAAQLIGGVWGGLGGAVGMTVGDLFDPIYILSAPITFILKFLLGLITGLVAHKIGRINTIREPKRYFKWALFSAIAGLLFNVIVDPLLRYYYKILILGKPAAALSLSLNLFSAAVNAIVSVVTATALYMALRPALARAGLLPKAGRPASS